MSALTRAGLLGSVAVIVAALTLTGCAATDAETSAPMTPSPTPSPCTSDPALAAAVDLVRAAGAGDESIPVFGPPGGRHSNLLTGASSKNFAAEPNPKGRGVLVTIVHGGGMVFARSSASRSGWLVLDGSIYPIDTDAAQAFGRLGDVWPAPVEAAAGVSDVFGLDAFGVEDFIAWNRDEVEEFRAFIDGENELCGPRSIWGS